MKGEFYKMDYEAWDTGTVDLSLEVEAAYLRLCHHMYRNAGPVPDSLKMLTGLFRCGYVRAGALRRQLLEAGKIRIDGDGLLTNGRVCRELAERELLATRRRLAGELGGTRSGVTRSKPLADRGVSEALASPQRNIREEIRGEDTPIAPEGADPDRFLEFKLAYPRRSTAFPTTAARKQWVKAIRRGVEPTAIIDGAKAYAEEQARIGKVGTEYVKTADSWLNQGRWEDYPTADEKPAVASSTLPISDATWRARVQTYFDRGGHWPWRCPAPDKPGTHVPTSVLREFGLPTGKPLDRLAA